jgi:uronate dehydrogenase
VTSPLENQTWVVTGAAGRIGSLLTRDLAPLVGRLILTDRRPIDSTSCTVADLTDLDAIRTIVAGADGVIHLGGIADEADFHDLAEANIVGTFHVLEAARLGGVSRVVYASSNRASGMYPAGTPISPTDEPRPDGLYGVSKVAGEALCRLYAEKFGLTTVALRIGSFEKRPAGLRHLSTWLSPADATRAFLAAMTAPVHGYECFYAVSANTRRWWDLSAGEALGYHPRDDAEAFAGDVPDAANEMTGPQAGSFAEPDFTLSVQRHLN